MDSFKEVLAAAAARKLIDLAKEALEIFDELFEEDKAKLEKFQCAADKAGWENVELVSPFLELIDDSKKDILRKRILDKANELKRELKE